jgi:hypothetical protein
MSQTSLLFQFTVGPAQQLSGGMLSEKSRIRATATDFPSRSFSAVLTELERIMIGGLCPRATRTGEALRLVLMRQQPSATD